MKYINNYVTINRRVELYSPRSFSVLPQRYHYIHLEDEILVGGGEKQWRKIL